MLECDDQKDSCLETLSHSAREGGDYRHRMEQGQVLVYEATCAAVALAEAEISTSSVPDTDGIKQRGIALQNLLRRVLEFGIKPKTPTSEESILLGIDRDSQAASVLWLIRALQNGFNNTPSNTAILPTAAVIPQASCCSLHSASAALQAYLHACFNAHTSATLFSAILTSQGTPAADSYHAWAPMHSSSHAIKELVATLVQLDAAPRHCFTLPRSVHACASCSDAVDAQATCSHASVDTTSVAAALQAPQPPEVEAGGNADGGPHACTDADSSQHDHHSFDVQEMPTCHVHACALNERSENRFPACSQVHAVHEGIQEILGAAESGQEYDCPCSPPAMQPFGSVVTTDVGGAASSPLMHAVQASISDDSPSLSMHHACASSRSLPEPSRTVSPILAAPESVAHRSMHVLHASVDASLLQPPTAGSSELIMHAIRPMHAPQEPALPCSADAGAFLTSRVRSYSRGDSLSSSFSSPRKNRSSQLGRHQSETLSLSQELLPTIAHACPGSFFPQGSAAWSPASGQSTWPNTAGGTLPPDIEITVGEFYVLEDSHTGRRHAEFEVATSVAGHEISRVTRRFRNIRTLQQQLRGSYRRGNLDLFLPEGMWPLAFWSSNSTGDGVLPSSWAEITRAAVMTIGAARTAPRTLAGRRALLQRCLTDLREQRPHLLQHAAALEFLGLRRNDPLCISSMHVESMLADQCTTSPSSAAVRQDIPEDSPPGRNVASWVPVSHSSTFGSTSGGALLGGLTLGHEPPVQTQAWRSRSTSPAKSIHRSPARSPHESMHYGTACSELAGSLNLEGSSSDFGLETVSSSCPKRINTTTAVEYNSMPHNPSRHIKMVMHDPYELHLSEADVAWRQQGMCKGCMRTLGAIHEIMHEAPVDTWRSALQSRSLLVDPNLWEHGSLGGRALETIGSIQNLLTPKIRTEKPKRCFYDGGLYCESCHAGQVNVIPSRIVNHWDFRKHPVSSDAFDFLHATRSHPLVQFDDDSQEAFFAKAPLLRDTTATRRRIADLVATLSERSANNTARDAALRIRITAGHRAHLVEGHELWSVLDLQDLAQGAAFAKLPEWLARMEKIAAAAASNALYSCRQR